MQESERTQGMQGMGGSVLDRLQAAVAQDPERARETIQQVRTEVQNMSPDQKEQLRPGVEQLQARMLNLTDEQKQQIQEIVQMIRS